MGNIIPFRYKQLYVKGYYYSLDFYNDLKSVNSPYIKPLSDTAFVNLQTRLYEERHITDDLKLSFVDIFKSHLEYIREDEFYYSNGLINIIMSQKDGDFLKNINVSFNAVPEHFKKYALKDAYYSIVDVENFDSTYSKTFIINFKLIRLFYYFYLFFSWIMHLYIWVYMLLIIGCSVFFRAIKFRQFNSIDLIIMSLLFMFVLETTITSYGALRPLHRYSYTIEFIYYLVFTIAIFYLPKIIEIKFKKFIHE